MEKNRLVVDVIKVVVKIIPKSETNLINELNHYKKCMFNQAPEVLSSAYCWIPFLNISKFITALCCNNVLELKLKLPCMLKLKS